LFIIKQTGTRPNKSHTMMLFKYYNCIVNSSAVEIIISTLWFG